MNKKLQEAINYIDSLRSCGDLINDIGKIDYVVDTIYKLIDENKQLKRELKFHKKYSLINNGKW